MFKKGQRVRCVSNPYMPMLVLPKPGDYGTITEGGTHFVGVQFSRTHFRRWLVQDAEGKITLEKA